jgi:hypothetical protein
MGEQLALFLDFENVAIWAQEHFLDLDLSRLVNYLQIRGSVAVKRAYGDWARFSRYRDDLLENSIDLIQLYSIRAGKNRADIRLALDALETAINRPHIGQIVIVSGDSDFGALVSKLREYGRYVLGIGPRDITHPLLVKSCDEFVYLDTVLGHELEADSSVSAHENARMLLSDALTAFGKRGELPVLATRLKQTLLSMDPTFNEADLGYSQFRAWLEDNGDLANLFFRELQMFVAPVDFRMPQEFVAAPVTARSPAAGLDRVGETALAAEYRAIFSRAVGVDLQTRRDILRDIYRELGEPRTEWAPSGLLAELQARYEAKGLARSKATLQSVWQIGVQQGVLVCAGDTDPGAPVRLADDIDSQATFIRRAEARFVVAVISAGLAVDQGELAGVLVEDHEETGYIEEILQDLVARDWIVRMDGQYRLSGHSNNPLHDDPYLRVVVQDLEAISIGSLTEDGPRAAQGFARSGMGKRTHDFAGSAQDFLMASRLQWDAFERQEPEATLADLRWYVASYASVRAGELSQVRHEYLDAQPYYLAFFSLVEEDTPLWDRMHGLINPMLHFYWRNLARMQGIELEYTTSPVYLAIEMATHSDPTLQDAWRAATRQLAAVNPGVLRRVADQIRFLPEASPHGADVAREIEEMIERGSSQGS